MKTVLIIANLFYASPRIPGLVKYLQEFEWQSFVLTPSLGERPDERFGPPNDFRENYRVIETPSPTKDVGVRAKKRMRSERYRAVRPLLKFLYRRYSEMVHYPDEEKSWKLLAIEAADVLFQKEKVDAMISSSSPATCHIIAEEIKNKYEVPWLADFRDLWTQNHNYSYSRLRRTFEKRLEVKTLSTSDALVTTSQPLAEELSALHKKKVYAITNGFDPDDMSHGTRRLTSKLTITYTGQIYKRQDPSKLLAALKELISDGTIDADKVEVRFYGPENGSLFEETKKYGLLPIVKQYGVITRHDSFERQRESQLLFQINWEDPEKKGLFSGKIFEYLAAQRPILATGENETVRQLIEETHSGMYCPTIEDIKKAISRSYLEYKSADAVTYRGSIDKINKYSYREMARGFADILNMISAAGGHAI